MNIIDLNNRRERINCLNAIPRKRRNKKQINNRQHRIQQVSGYELATIKSAASELLSASARHPKLFNRQQGDHRFVRTALAASSSDHRPFRGEKNRNERLNIVL